jgi:hypothetical protein
MCILDKLIVWPGDGDEVLVGYGQPASVGGMTYDDIRQQAELSVRRGCGFALMAIVTAMVGFSGEPWIAVRSGAVFVLIAAVILFIRGRHARRRNYRHTEVWLMIEDAPALPRERLQDMIGGALADAYFAHAKLAAYIALTMSAIALAVGGVPSG